MSNRIYFSKSKLYSTTNNFAYGTYIYMDQKQAMVPGGSEPSEVMSTM